MTEINQEMFNRVTKDLIKKGLIVEAGFAGLHMMMIPKNASKEQINDMRIAFFAGAQHLFSSIMTALDPEEEPTPADLERMNSIHKELEKFHEECNLLAMPTGRKQ